MKRQAHRAVNMVGVQTLQYPAATNVAAVAGLKKRMRMFVEAVVKMVSPVFLAACVSLARVNMGDQPGLRDSLSPVAGCTVAFGIFSLLPLTFPNWFPHNPCSYLLSMFSIHLCGVLLMVLPYLALVLINERFVNLGIFLIIVIPVFVIGGIKAMYNKHLHRATTMGGDCLDELENSVDFLAAITFLLFLGLGGFMLQGRGEYSTVQQDEEMSLLLFIIMALSFFVFLSGVVFMLEGVLPTDDGGDEHTCENFQVYNYIFGCALGFIVLLITHGKLRCWGASASAFVVSGLPFAVWAVNPFRCDAIRRGDDEEVKPASLDLTKVTFTGFLSISVYTISQNSPLRVGEWSSWFIFFTAIAVNNCLGWRLLTHEKKSPAARFTAANFASLCAHIYTILSVIPFGFMARNAFRKFTTDALSPAPSPAPS